MDHFDSPGFTRAAAHLAELGINSNSWTNIVVAAEALERGLTVRRSRTQPRMVIEHRGTVKTWAGGSTDHNADLAQRIAAQKDVASGCCATNASALRRTPSSVQKRPPGPGHGPSPSNAL